MITPVNFVLEDFLTPENLREYASIKMEALTGSLLIDHLILLDFCNTLKVQQVLKEKYKLAFAWLNIDPTPPEYADIAKKHHVLIERGRNLVVYIPLGQAVDDALLQVDIPSYEIIYRFIADCNVKLIQTRQEPTFISESITAFRPLLVFRRLILECINHGAADIHFNSYYYNKQPVHVLTYRETGELRRSKFMLDFNMTKRVIQAVIGKLSPTSALDIDARGGVLTSVRDLFHDGTCDLRVTNLKVSAGYYMEISIQTVTTSTLSLDELGFPSADVQAIRDISTRRTGLTLLTGKMRTGKNTTMFAMIKELPTEKMQLIEYSSPIENHMSHPQVDYEGNIEVLREQLSLAKKQDLDLAVLNEIPNADVAFAVRDLVNSAIAVWTTMHVNRVWHLPGKLYEFFGRDYKTIVSQLNAVINHRMFRRWSGPGMRKRLLVKEQGPFELFAYKAGVRQYFEPEDISKVKWTYQPLTEILVITDAMRTSMMNFDEIWRAEQMMESQIHQQHGTLETKVADFINNGRMSLEELRVLY